ncbi:MAG: DNA recombination protein RmuC [Deltaproteobacteria bacterium]|nr:DNA recombination protein RmuC [Deltaproteobacteria bacterium]
MDSKARSEQDAKRLPELERQVADLRDENLELKEQIARLKKEREITKEMLQWLERAEGHLRETFQALASQVIESNTNDFLKLARTQLDSIFNQARGDWKLQKTEFQTVVQPLERALETLDSQVRDLDQKREGAYQKLQEQLWQLGQTHEQLQLSTTNLVQALKAPSVRGAWGNVQLRRVVEMAGMIEHVDFNGQTVDPEQPDMIVYLPNKVILPVDAKTSMQAYLEGMEASDDQLRKVKLDEHPRAMRQRIQELGEPRYRKQFERTADVVVMFVPNDACLGVAFERDPGLLEYATQQGVLLATPVTLLALLKAVAYGWQQHQAAENARQIALQGKQLYKCLSNFLESLGDLGKGLNQAVLDYNKTVGSLESRVLPAARRLREMGVASEGLPAAASIAHQAIPPPSPDLDGEAGDGFSSS